LKIEIAVPCHNEESTIGKVVCDFRVALPKAEVVVYDNNSKDNSATVARKAGARVVRVNRQGKGHVVQKIFESSTADIIVMVDGDDTYEADDVRLLTEPLISDAADMTIGTRLHTDVTEFRKMHHFGNRLLTRLLNTLFREQYKDILSGYRAFNRRFIENVPVISVGFEVETELVIQAVENGMAVSEFPIRFRDRPPGSYSKLNTTRDGYRILITMVRMLRDHRPLLCFSVAGLFSGCIGGLFCIAGFLLGAQTGGLSGFRNIGAMLIILSAVLFLCGLVLSTINTRMRELSSLGRRRRI